ncbi:MAG: transglycosylase domain-containing protein, partial [Eggerthellaceae bacterium]
VVLAGGVGVYALGSTWLEDLPDYTDADAFNTAQPTEVYASDGTTLLAKFQLENREPVELDQVGQYVLEGTVATEDERFYEHGGFDITGIGRALVNNITGGELEGASTITQQFVRNTSSPRRWTTSPSSARCARCTFPSSWRRCTPRTRYCSCT